MLNFLSPDARSQLRIVAYLSPAPRHGQICRALLLLDRGCSVAAVARHLGRSRPWVYRYLRLWTEFHDVALMHPRRLRPWRVEGKNPAPPAAE